ncbi:hypothetical protein [Helicobacter sp. NHP22-001]|uniref:hypothetical protein n=1 Tax=Helicobacter sp. NHP22-001 TaxID=3040202 RepID=UPI00244D9926|nr:hypothetical protein [Helicobacter sp. NHP22-001]GMB96372.1 hypothetical protein NHP22001_09610 [Helicobacter sp. NHP22-001]
MTGDSKDTAQESLASLEASIRQFKTNLTALCERAGVGKWQAPKYAKEHFEKSIDKLKEQASKAETVENARTSLETVLDTIYSVLIEPKEQDDKLTAQDKLKAIETRFQLEKNKTEILDIIYKRLKHSLRELGHQCRSKQHTPRNT